MAAAGSACSCCARRLRAAEAVRRPAVPRAGDLRGSLLELAVAAPRAGLRDRAAPLPLEADGAEASGSTRASPRDLAPLGGVAAAGAAAAAALGRLRAGLRGGALRDGAAGFARDGSWGGLFGKALPLRAGLRTARAAAGAAGAPCAWAPPPPPRAGERARDTRWKAATGAPSLSCCTMEAQPPVTRTWGPGRCRDASVIVGRRGGVEKQ